MAGGKATYSLEMRGDHPVIRFAAAQLKHYLTKMLGQVSFRRSGRSGGPRRGFIVAEANAAPDLIAPRRITDPSDRDQISIQSAGTRLLLAGNNPRSVLFAVYDFLERLGARWLHAGPGGDALPTLRRLDLSGWRVAETASFRYRGVDVEGAFTPKHAIAKNAETGLQALRSLRSSDHLLAQPGECNNRGVICHDRSTLFSAHHGRSARLVLPDCRRFGTRTRLGQEDLGSGRAQCVHRFDSI